MSTPAKRPCGSCPYRRDVPSGVWAAEEYDKLPPYDAETFDQPLGMFYCHQQDGHLCAGWVGCHDMEENLSFRLAAASGELGEAEVDLIYDYVSPVPLFESGAQAAEHGRREIADPGDRARTKIHRLIQLTTAKENH